MPDEFMDVTPDMIEQQRRLVLECLSPQERLNLYNILIMSDVVGDDVLTADEEEALKGPPGVDLSFPKEDIDALIRAEAFCRMMASTVTWQRCEVCGKETPHYRKTGTLCLMRWSVTA